MKGLKTGEPTEKRCLGWSSIENTRKVKVSMKHVAGSHGNLAVLAAYADLVLQHSPAEEGNECGSSRDFEKMWSD